MRGTGTDLANVRQTGTWNFLKVEPMNTTELRLSEKYKTVEAVFGETGYQLVHMSTQHVSGYQFHASLFRDMGRMGRRGKSFIVMHNPDGIATCEEVRLIKQDDDNASPTIDDIINAI
jgi:hypothetical protein